MPITNVENGHITGYKYFGFGGLDKDRKGLKAFEGTRPGNKTVFNLFLTPGTKSAFRVNGEAIDLPDTPVRSTNANGIVGYDLYETTYKLPSGITGILTVSASASDPDVKVAVTQAESKPGTAVVRFDYKGVVKTYRVVFALE